MQLREAQYCEGDMVRQAASPSPYPPRVMSSFKKYYFGFRLALANELIHRMNFLFGVLRRVIFSITLVYLYQHIPRGIGSFSSTNLIQYTLISYVLSSLIHAYAMRGISEDIVNGDLTNYLVKPIKFLPYWGARMLATRFILGIASIIGLLCVWAISGIPFSSLFVVAHPIETFILFFGALIIVQLIDFLCGMIAFWTTDEHGVQWLVSTAVLFCSGALMPISVLPRAVQIVLNMTPLPSLVYAPTQMYLGNFSEQQFLHAFVTQLVWIVVCTAAVVFVWMRGVKSYEAYGR